MNELEDHCSEDMRILVSALEQAGYWKEEQAPTSWNLRKAVTMLVDDYLTLQHKVGM